MSHRALVAEQQPNDRFNVYHSQNGAEDIQLLDELQESLDVHGRIDWESLTGSTTPEMLQRLPHADEPGYSADIADPDHLVEPRPVATNRRREEVLLADNLLQYEVLYVVEDGDVQAYWLAWAYPDVIRPLHRHVDIDVYDPADVPNKTDDLLALIEDGDALRTISGFESGWLSDDVVRQVTREYHRWIYELQSMWTRDPARKDIDKTEDVPQVLSTPEYWVAFRTNETDPLVPQSHPFIVPIRIESLPHASSERIRDTAARTRFSIGAGLNAAENASEEEVRQARLEALMEIVDAHVDRIAPEFIPGKVGAFIEEYQRAPSHRDLKDIWKN